MIGRPLVLGGAYPYGAVINGTNVKLVDDAPLTAEQLDALTRNAPSTYDEKLPRIERDEILRNWVQGAGVRESATRNATRQPYYVADGVDLSGGFARLADEFLDRTPSGTGVVAGEIKSFVEMEAPVGTNRLWCICGTQVLCCEGDPGTAADWHVARDFGVVLSNPSAPTVTPQGATGASIYGYKIVAVAGATQTAASAETTITNGNATLSASNFNRITWSAVPWATGYRVYRTTGGPWQYLLTWTDLADTVLTFDDTGPALNADTPTIANVGAAGGTPYSYRVVAVTGTNAGQTTLLGTTGTGNATLDGTNYNSVTWTLVSGATYRIYRTVGGATQGLLGTAGLGTNTFNDTGIAAQDVPPSANTTIVQTPTKLVPYRSTINVGGSTAQVLNLYVTTNTGYMWRWPNTASAITTGWTQGSNPKAGRTAIMLGRSLIYAVDVGGGLTPSLATMPTDTDPLTGSTTPYAILVGDGSHKVTELAGLEEMLWIFAEDGVWRYPYQAVTFTGVASNVFPVDVSENFPGPRLTTNGLPTHAWDGRIYSAYGEGGLVRIDGTDVEEIGIGRLAQNASSVKGRFTALAGWNRYHLFATIYDGSNSYLAKFGTWDNPEADEAEWTFSDAWHYSLKTWSSKQASAAVVTNISGSGTTGNPRLIVGFSNGTLALAVLPRYSPNPLNDSNCRYVLSGTAEFPKHTLDQPGNFRAYTVAGPVLTSVLTARLAYDVDNTGSYTNLTGNPSFDATGERHALSTSSVTGRTIQTRLTLTSNANTATPVVERVVLHEQEKAPAIFGWWLVVDARDYPVLKDGRTDLSYLGETVRAALRAAVATVGDVPCTLPDGSTQSLSLFEYSEEMKDAQLRAAPGWVIPLAAVQFALQS